MPSLKKILTSTLKNAGKIGVLGVGSELRGDDACGILVAARLVEICPTKGRSRPRVKVFFGATAPENLTGEIKRYNPTHLLVVDSANMGKKPGTVQWIEMDKTQGLSFCTHNLPLKILTDYLAQSIHCEIMVIGIQPKSIEFGKAVSASVQKSANRLADMIKSAMPDSIRDHGL